MVTFWVAGISYRTAPVAWREQLAVSPARLACQRCRLKIAGDLREVVLLSTCNRVEVYAAAQRLPPDPAALLGVLARSPVALEQHLYLHQGAEALAHLFAVASSLDSMVLGETEITGQVKAAYEHARAVGMTGRVLNQAFQKALYTAKQVRSQTQIGCGATSVGGAAVELVERIFARRSPTKRS
jgi:glutamyl-tRNA reductase